MLVGIFWHPNHHRPTKDELEKSVNCALPHMRCWTRIKNWREAPCDVLRGYELQPSNSQHGRYANSLALELRGGETELVLFRLASPSVDYAVFDVPEFSAWKEIVLQTSSLIREMGWAVRNVKNAVQVSVSLPTWAHVQKTSIFSQEDESILTNTVEELRTRIWQRWEREQQRVLATLRQSRDSAGRLVMASGTSALDAD
jgi:hypothetical protein